MTRESFDMGFPTESITEGKVRVLVPKLEAFAKSPSEYAPSKAPVFFNPAMELNRDISVLAMQAYQKLTNREITVCEPLTGCGIRGIRYAAEVNGIKQVAMSDISEKAVKLTLHNIEINRLTEKATAEHGEANHQLSHYSKPYKRFDVIDIDPFGSPSPYVDSAFRALRNKGLLTLTATDMAPLCGVHSKACIRKYGGKPLRTEYCHELAVRLLAGSVARTAAKQDIGTNVVFSHSRQHFIRLYMSTDFGSKKADAALKNLGYIAHCFKCFHREIKVGLFLAVGSTACSECGSKLDFAGPLWVGRIVDSAFCRLMKEEAKRRKFRNGTSIEGILELIESEGEAPVSYYVIDELSGALKLPVSPARNVVDVLRKKGFRAFQTHFSTRGVKTDASAAEIKEILREMTVYPRHGAASFK